RRGRVGHEKRAPVPYLIDQRGVHFIFHVFGDGSELGFDRFIPLSLIEIDTLRGRTLHWDPQIMAVMKQRGARFADFPTELDRYIAGIAQVPDAVIQADFAKFKRFYFDHVSD